ncbi:MAG: c-type cytochrome [Gammaproteobacteria bacterium]|nr:c-type cytochrome [Gammaproteobacteria bacterium]
MSNTGLGFSYKSFLALIVVFACCILLFEYIGDLGASLIKDQVKDSTSKYSDSKLEDNIPPLFTLNKNQQQPSEVSTTKIIPTSLSTEMNGEDAYNSACFVCHTTGAGGAPFIGVPIAWEARMKKGTETLMKHSIEGYVSEDGGIMPAKGGRLDLSDQEVLNAFVYMLDQL